MVWSFPYLSILELWFASTFLWNGNAKFKLCIFSLDLEYWQCVPWMCKGRPFYFLLEIQLPKGTYSFKKLIFDWLLWQQFKVGIWDQWLSRGYGWFFCYFFLRKAEALCFYPYKRFPSSVYANWVLALPPLRLDTQGHFIFAISDTLIHSHWD